MDWLPTYRYAVKLRARVSTPLNLDQDTPLAIKLEGMKGVKKVLRSKNTFAINMIVDLGFNPHIVAKQAMQLLDSQGVATELVEIVDNYALS